MRQPEDPRCRSAAVHVALAALALLAGASGGCQPAPPPVRTMGLVDVEPRSSEGVYLNEDLVFTLTREVDPTTVTSASLSVEDELGRPARGERLVEGRMVRFRPAQVLSTDLSDGGYRPDTRYFVELTAFPHLDGLRGVGGEPLVDPLRWSFRTVAVREPREGFVFDDASPGWGEPLRLADAIPEPGEPPSARTLRIEPDGSLYLLCNEPLDPSTLFGADFQLFTPAGEAVEIEARFLANHDVGASPRGGPCAVIELLPRRTLEPADPPYMLRIAADLRLRDFGGNRVYRPRGMGAGQPVEVHESPEREGRGELHFNFLDHHRFSPLAVPDVDGTAMWGGSGRVEVVYPAAAGDGVDGHVMLAAREPRRDVRAVRIRQTGGKTALSPEPGTVVLRAQGSIVLRGTLERHVRGPRVPEPGVLFDQGRRLGEWLAATVRGGEDWTVLIAGGDLVIDGEIDVNTPLLLVAGGYLRVQGRVKAAENQLWLLGRGGGMSLRGAHDADLVVDPPETNPLREALTFVALSSPVPPQTRRVRWLKARAGGGGGGSWRVRYLLDEEHMRHENAVDHPRLLDGQGPIRLRIELRLPARRPPGPSGFRREDPWDPPFVDFVSLTWSPADLEGGG